MQAENQLFSRFYTALIFKAVGVVLIVGTLVDFIVLTTPPNIWDNEWVSNLIVEYVGRGVIPLLGLAFLFVGFWLGDRLNSTHWQSKKGLFFWSMVLSGVLGLLFLLLAPLHLNSSRLISAAASRAINEQATTAINQLDNRLAQERAAVQTLLESPQKLAELEQQLRSDKLSKDEKANLEQVQATLKDVQANPAQLDKEITATRKAETDRIQKTLLQAQADLRLEMRKSRVRITTVSLILAVGYFSVTWTGLGAQVKGRSPQTTLVKKRK